MSIPNPASEDTPTLASTVKEHLAAGHKVSRIEKAYVFSHSSLGPDGQVVFTRELELDLEAWEGDTEYACDSCGLLLNEG